MGDQRRDVQSLVTDKARWDASNKGKRCNDSEGNSDRLVEYISLLICKSIATVACFHISVIVCADVSSALTYKLLRQSRRSGSADRDDGAAEIGILSGQPEENYGIIVGF